MLWWWIKLYIFFSYVHLCGWAPFFTWPFLRRVFLLNLHYKAAIWSPFTHDETLLSPWALPPGREFEDGLHRLWFCLVFNPSVYIRKFIADHSPLYSNNQVSTVNKWLWSVRLLRQPVIKRIRSIILTRTLFCSMAESKSRMPALPAQSDRGSGGTDQPALTLHYSWDHADYTGLSQYLSQIDWQSLISYNLTSDTLWSSFCKILHTGIDMYVPTRHIDPRLSSVIKTQNCKKISQTSGRPWVGRDACGVLTGGGLQTVHC